MVIFAPLYPSTAFWSNVSADTISLHTSTSKSKKSFVLGKLTEHLHYSLYRGSNLIVSEHEAQKPKVHHIKTSKKILWRFVEDAPGLERHV